MSAASWRLCHRAALFWSCGAPVGRWSLSATCIAALHTSTSPKNLGGGEDLALTSPRWCRARHCSLAHALCEVFNQCSLER